MAYRELIDYVHAARARGASDSEISERLQAAGWYAVDVRDALELHGQLNKPAAQLASTRTHHHARVRSFDASMIIFATLAFIIGFAGYLFLSQ